MELILIRGLSGSGKSTKAKEYVQRGYLHYENDMYFMVKAEYRFDRSRLPDAIRWCERKVEEALQKGYSVVVSNTFLTHESMRSYWEMSCRLGAQLKIIEMTTQYANIHDIPEEILEKQRQNWEPLRD